ncbi:conserved hypothetical protein [Altererythrobacter sp. B11]|uniref:GNAT family N-acetyltransferase n=1 Tax=Altererythrobacter sp. B11 TaxID=2060312 RepID=UPI000DC6F3DD|nr:GNAT family N-acetyltransferase [Altererythrobacter sp. B11]BBC72968.1 conserved hypothetical protein [Altererythrobacter sp. B11]
MTAISYHDTVNDLQGLSFAGHGPFARLEWFGLIEAAGTRPLIAVHREKHGETVALPLQGDGRALANCTNWYAFTWSDLATPGSDRPTALRRIARDLAKRADRITLTKLAEEDGTADRLHRAFREAGWLVRRSRCDSNHVLPLHGRSYAEYLADRPGKLRTTLKRKAKKVEIEIFSDFQPDAWQIYEHVYAQSWKPEEGDPALLRRFAEQEGAAGRLRLALARHEGAVVAAQFWTVEDGTAYIHKLAHLESARPLSAGTVLSAALFERVIDIDRVELVDFGTGNDPYKAEWMEEIRPRYRLDCWRAERPANWPALARAALRTLVSRFRAG